MCTTRLIVSGASGLTREGRVASFKSLWVAKYKSSQVAIGV
jgi:hypothetical protein